MEEVLDLYTEEHSEEMPLICMDEASKQLLTNEQPCIPLQPGRGVREDYRYERRGTQVCRSNSRLASRGSLRQPDARRLGRAGAAVAGRRLP
jgi:hypothetical protein